MKLYYRLGIVLAFALSLFLLVYTASAQPPVPHPLEGRDDCLACHQTGVGGAPRVAADHIGRTNETCGQCHQPAGVESTAALTIPHSLEGREDCLACHEAGLGGASQIPDDHEGRSNEICSQCHAAASTTPVAASYIPHPVEGRDDCLACHQEGVLGSGDGSGASPVPDNHEGRANESCRQCHISPSLAATPVPPIPHPVEEQEACLRCHVVGIGEPLGIPESHVGRQNEVCQTCHQPPVLVVVTPTPEAIPTPIQHPTAPGQNFCLDCHRTLGGEHQDIANQWDGSIHADLDVACADCHGGDPGINDQVLAKLPDTGYIGTPSRATIPSLCGSCHADPEIMRPYGLPTDQMDDYGESVHGMRLAQGDERTATCYDCHDGHGTKAVDDPESRVYPRKLPATCAECHADEERMAPYDIATNQFELYQKSVHGRALMIFGNTEAPSCPTCHSSHAAALPGYGKVVDVCGQCHSASEEYYLKGGHRRGMQEGSDAPRCVTCHGRYDVEAASLELFVGDEPRHCGSCHASDSLEGAAIDAMYQALVRAEQAFEAAKKAVYGTSTAELDRETLELRLEEAEAKLAEVAAAQHELQLKTVEERAAEVESISAEVQQAVETTEARRDLGSWVPAGVIAAALALGGLIANLVRRRAETK